MPASSPAVPVVAGGSGESETSRWSIERLLTSTVVGLARRRRLLLPAAAAVTVVLALFALKLDTTFDVRDFFDDGSDFVVSLDKLDEHVADTGGEDASIYIRGDLADPEALAGIRTLLERMEDNEYLAKDRWDGSLQTGGPTLLTYLTRVTTNEYARSQVHQATGIEIADADSDGLPDTVAQTRAVYDFIVENGIRLDETTAMHEAARIRQRLYHDPSSGTEDITVFSVEVPGTREQSTVAAARKALEADLQVLDDIPAITFPWPDGIAVHPRGVSGGHIPSVERRAAYRRPPVLPLAIHP